MKSPTSEPKRKRGAQPGNVNAVKYAWRALFNRGVLKDEYAYLKPWMDEYLAGLIDDKGGKENMSNAETYIADLAGRAHGSQLMIVVEASRKGLIRESKDGWDLQPGFKEQSKYMQIELKALQTYGTARRVKVQTLQELLDGPDEDEAQVSQPSRANGNGKTEGVQ